MQNYFSSQVYNDDNISVLMVDVDMIIGLCISHLYYLEYNLYLVYKVNCIASSGVPMQMLHLIVEASP